MSVAQERAIDVELDGVNERSPRDDSPESSDGVNHRSGRSTSGVNERAGRETSRGERGGIHGVNHRSPKPLDKTINTPVAPTGTTTQDSKLPRRELPEDWKPNVPARIFAAEHGIDLKAAVEKFRLWALADDRRCRNWDSRFLLWLHNEKPMQPTSLTIAQPCNPHTHTWQCDHVNKLLRRDADEAQPDELACHLARRLNDGQTETQALADLGLAASDEWEAA
jgi:hypothetical protein